MRAPLTVRVHDGYRSRNVTKHTTGLKFRKTAPGGHHQASMQITLPRDTFTDLGPADKVFVYNAVTGDLLWVGYTEDPGAIDGPSGQSYDITAMGGMVLASDQSQPLLYVDRRFDNWQRGGNSTEAALASATAEASASPATGEDSLVLQFNPGVSVGTGAFAQMNYDVRNLGLEIGGYIATFAAGATDTGFQFRYIFEAAKGGPNVQWNLSTTPRTSGRRAIENYVPGPRFVVIQLVRTGLATNIATDNVWVAVNEVAVMGQLKSMDGEYAQSPFGHVLASQVAEDLFARLLSFCDPVRSVIDATTLPIDQLAYLEGTNATGVLTDLGRYEPDFLWEILETGPDGRHRFNYRAWPTGVRYEISTRDGYEAPGGEVDLCNRIAIFWTDIKGQAQTTIRGSYVEELGNRSPVLPDGSLDPAFVGRVRDAEPVTLPDGLGSAANAERIGDELLSSKSGAVRSAKAVLRRPILDHLTGLEVMPWEIEPGYLVRVRETGEDLRLTEMEYDDEACATSLTLGDPVLTEEQRVARLWASKGKLL